MNLSGKFGTYKLPKRVLAIVLVAAMLATQFLTTAVWSFADAVASPSGTQYNVVLDADNLDAVDAFTPTTAVSKVTANALSGNAYAWNMTASGEVALSFPATGYSDEVALVVWMDTTALDAEAEITITLRDGTHTYGVAGDVDDNGLIFTIPVDDPEGGLGIPAVSDAGAVTIPAGLVGWLMIPFDSFTGSVPTGEVTGMDLSTAATGAIYLDDLGFASVDWSENFYVNLLGGTLTANRRPRCEAYGHDYADATCTAPKTCHYCGATDGLANGHTWDIADCAQDRVCLICNAPEAAKSHSYVSDGDCFTPDTCDSCGKVQPDSELGHHYADATCTVPKTCSGCGDTQGAALGHNWHLGTCNACGEVVYTVAEDFEEADVTGTAGCWSLVADKTPFGQALRFGRENAATNISIKLDKKGTAADKAIVFYYDNTESGNDGEAYFYFRPYTAGGCGITLSTDYTYQAVVDGEVLTLKPSSNFALKLPKKTKGWVVLPLPAAGTWSYGGGDGKYLGTVEDIASVYMEFYEFHNASVVVDQMGFTKDVAQFQAFAAAGNVNLNGCTDYELCEGDNHAWKDAVCNLPKICTLCGLAQGLPTGIHNYKDATCSSPKTCIACGATEGEANESLHVWKDANCGYPKTCENCGATEGETVGEHVWGDATCTAPKMCTVCQKTEGVALGHTWDANDVCTVCGITRPLYVVGQGFESAVDGDFTDADVLSCGSPFGSSIKLSAAAAATKLPFKVIGTAGNEALVFWYDATGATGEVKMQFIPRYEGGCGITLGTAHPVMTVIDGILTEKNTAVVSENFTLKLAAGTSGWVIIPIDVNKYGAPAVSAGLVAKSTLWSYGGGDNAFGGTTDGLASVDVRLTAGGSIILDQFGYAEVMATFAAKAVTGNENMDGYTGIAHTWGEANCGHPKTCSGCGATEGDRVGTHNFVAGVCTVCGNAIYDVAENFNDANITGTEGSWQLVTEKSPFGQALYHGRGSSATSIKIVFDEVGLAAHKAVVFWYDVTESGFSGTATLKVIPRDAFGNGITLGMTGNPKYTYYTVINGELAAANPKSNFHLELPAGTKGWIILPLPAAGTWNLGDTGESGKFTGTCANLAALDIGFSEYNDASTIIDQIGFTSDVETFQAAALAGNSNIPGYESSFCEKNGHSWTEETCGVGSVCSVCNLPNPEKPATGLHTWEPATCGKDSYCITCGAIHPTDLATGQHTWVAATCGKDGYCSVCETKNPADLATGQHTLVEETCGMPEYCTVCQQTFTPATGAHDWEEATCTTPKNCKVCKQVEGAAPGHTWGDDAICDVCGSEKTVYTIAQGFEATVPNVSNATGTAFYELLTGKTDFGQALNFGRTEDKAGLRIHFDVYGKATDNALVFWYDVTGSGFNGDATMSFIPRDVYGYGITLHPTYTYYTVINGKVSKAYPSSNFTLKLPKGTKGWIVMPLPDAENTHNFGGGTDGAYTGSCDQLAAVDVEFVYYHHASVLLDQFGFAEDVEAFLDAARFGNLNLNGYTGKPSSCTEHTWSVANCGQPKHCITCGWVDGVREGEHSWEEATCEDPKTCKICYTTEGAALGHSFVDGFCTLCHMEEGDYQVVMDFDGRNPINITNDKCTYVMADVGYKGNGMILDRGTGGNQNSSEIRFAPTGNAEDKALVFFMDASFNTAKGNLILYAYDTGKSRCLKPAAGSKIYAIDLKGNKKELVIPDSNGVPFEVGFEGWYVIPLDVLTQHHWGTGLLTPGAINELFLGYGGQAGSLFELDNFGFTTDVEGFIAEAVAGKINSDVFGEADVESNIGKPLPGLGGDDEEYVPDLSNPSPSDYNVAVDFDGKMFTSLVDHETQEGNAGFSKVVSENMGKPNYAGQSLMWNRGGDGTVTRVEMEFKPTGYSDENAVVFWINTDGMLSNGHGITMLLYGENASDGSEVCMKLGNGKVYRTVDTRTGKVKDRICTQDGSVYVDSKFEGFVVIPFSALISHWGGLGVKLKPGTADKIWLYHGYTYDEVLYIDNLGFTHNIDNFAEQAVAKKLNDTNDRVDVGRPGLPLPEGAGISDTNLSGGPDGKTADNGAFKTVVNFNSKVPTALTSANAYVKLVKEGASGYGSALNWFKNDDDFATEITLSTEGGQKTDEGIALWISTKDSGNTFDTHFRFMPHDFVTVDDKDVERCWRLIKNATYYLLQDGVATSRMVKQEQNITVPGGFEGWVIVPFEALEIHWGTPANQKAEEQVVDPTRLTRLNLYCGNTAITENVQIDEYGFFTTARKFIESMGAEFPRLPVTSAVLQSLDGTFGVGGIGKNPTVGTMAWSDKASLALQGDLSNDSYALDIKAAAGTSVRFPIDIATSEDDPYGIQREDLPKVATFTGLGFWITTEKAVDLSVSLLLNNGKTYKINATGKTTDIYRLVNENTALTTAHQFGKSDTIKVPAGFTGWVVVDTKLMGGKVDLSKLKETIITFKTDASVSVDSIRSSASAVDLIYNEMNFPMDTDLLVSTNPKKAVISVNEDGDKILTLYGDMTSGEFRHFVDVRGGYRIVFDDNKGHQMFGAIDLMGKVGCIKVYLGSMEQAVYYVDVIGGSYNEIENGYDIDGDGVIDGIGVDIDGDGVFDGIGWDPDGDGTFNGVIMDINGDGVVDGIDLDFDGYLDAIDLNGDWRGDGIDMDGDGVIDGMGIDIDGDGWYDGVIEGIDVNDDGIWDGVDMDGDGVVDYYDMDGDAICDGIGIDRDGDGVVDFVVSGVDFDGDGLYDGMDINGDGISDGIALDLNNDGTCDGVGIDRNGSGFVNGMAIDLDGDGRFDGVDIDFDGIIDEEYLGDEPPADGGDQPTDTDPDDPPVKKNAVAWWVYVLCGVGGLVVLGAAAVVVLIIVKRKAKAPANE